MLLYKEKYSSSIIESPQWKLTAIKIIFGKTGFRAIRDQEPAYILSDELAAAVFLEPSIILESEQIVRKLYDSF